MIAGATGTGKGVTLQIIAEGLSAAGVPVILRPSRETPPGLSRSGSTEAKLHEPFMQRARTIGLDLE